MSGFDKLDIRIKKWVWDQRWTELRDIQEKAIDAILNRNRAVLITAATAAGKTEAAFFPVLTSISDTRDNGFSVLHISPLKALINDQFQRLDQICELMEMPIVRWHGDAPQAAKSSALKNPRGVCLITPESIEALLCRRPAAARKLFVNLKYIIIDELHYFLEGPRGLHLSALLNRLDAISSTPARRIGLSATVGDIEYAKDYLTSGMPQQCELVASDAGKPELKLQIKAYIEDEEVDDPDALEGGEGSLALDRIADDIFRYFRGSSNLVFAGSRRRVESLTDRLRDRCEAASVNNEFFAHHGSLSREMREDIEFRLKASGVPATAVATTTLELGIDIGEIKAVGQVGSPISMSSLRQRVGRTGRRPGVPAVLRLFVREERTHAGSDLIKRMNLEVIKSIAAVRLLVAGYLERPETVGYEPSVVLHQILSLICEYGGLTASDLYRLICSRGALRMFSKADFATLLKAMASPELKFLEQSPDRLIMLGEFGERVTVKKDFFALFETIEEWKIVTAEKELGSLPLSNMLGIGSFLAFAGKRWRVEAVDQKARVITVVAHRSGKVPQFESVANENLDDRLINEMRLVFEGQDRPAYLDKDAVSLLIGAREVFQQYELSRTVMVEVGKNVHVFTWAGSKLNMMLALAMKHVGCSVLTHPIGVTVVDLSAAAVRERLSILNNLKPGIEEIIEQVEVLPVGKWDDYVPVDVLKSQWMRTYGPSIDPLHSLIQRMNRQL